MRFRTRMHRPRMSTIPGGALFLLFVGPPGVGKTSIAQSIARSLGRQVRPHLTRRRPRRGRHPWAQTHLRRSHAGAGSSRGCVRPRAKNPVFLLDEVDKARGLVPGRSQLGAPRGSGPGPELDVRRPLLGNPVRPLRGPLHRDGELPGPDTWVHFSIGWSESTSPDTPKRKSCRSRSATCSRVSGRRTASPTRSCRWRTRPSSRSCRTTHVRPASGSSNGRSGKFARKVARQIAAGKVEHDRTPPPRTFRELLGRPRVHPERMAEEDHCRRRDGDVLHPDGRRHHVRRGERDAGRGAASCSRDSSVTS